MSITYGDGKPALGSIELILDALVKSESIADFCRAIVHSGFTQHSVQGCYIYSLDSESQLTLVSGYGRTYLEAGVSLSAWDDDPIAECIRKKEHTFLNPSKEPDKGILAIPLLRDSIPIGALTLILDSTTKGIPVHESLIPILSKLGAYSLTTFRGSQSRSSGNYFPSSREANGEDLTSRQIKILDLMGDGMVNIEIARELMLSESTIRQETVRIYRALGVPNRLEAAKKGRSLGLINRSTPPPPASRSS